MVTSSTSTLRNRGRASRYIEIVVHVIIWAYLFLSPLLFSRWNEAIDWPEYFRRLYFPASYCVLFYVNYFYLVPRRFIRKRYVTFVLVNVVLIALVYFGRDIYGAMIPVSEGWHRPRRFHHPAPDEGRMRMIRTVFIVQGIISQMFVVFLAVVVRLSGQWKKAEAARREAELGKSEAELKNLKNQINPHFLLNTLNNIYALIAFDTAKAQEAVQELGKLLRYVLYETQEQKVSLRKEADFLTTYISLMRMRMADTMKTDIHIEVPDGDSVQVAPLIFISLVENAFKHGVNPSGPGFIRVSLKVENGHIRFACTNSNHPKNSSDKSPGGIGLKQVRGRLDHAYPGHYRWEYGTDESGTVYRSEIDIFTGRIA